MPDAFPSMLRSLLSFALIFSFGVLNAQDSNEETSSEVNYKKRKTTLAVGSSVFYAGTMIGLNQLWYADFDRSPFHFFNDNKEWMQMDKAGHAVTAYHFSKAAKNSMLWAGFDAKKSRNYGALYGWLFQSSIEILDGFSTEWGASTGDIIANTAGSGMMWTQDLIWQEQRINMKYSYSKSEFASIRPNTFGTTWQERLLKDYNGQTYWLSANISSFIQKENKFPKWLNVAAGYGIDGVIGANNNEPNTFDRNRQYYLSLDVGLDKIKTKSKVVNFVLTTFSFVKIPAPTLEVKDGRSTFYWLYF